MKKSLFSLIAGVIIALTSCSQTDEVLTTTQENEQIVAFTVQAPAVTRAAVEGTKLTRYIVEAYENNNLGEDATPLRAESSTGTLQLTLKKNTEYTFVFWADGGTAKTETTATGGYWNAAKLRNVYADKADKIGEPAYCATKQFNSKDFAANTAITLTNATAQVNFVETKGLAGTSNTLKVTYGKRKIMNIATGEEASYTSGNTYTYTISGTIAANAVMATDYILAPKNEQTTLEVKVQLNDEAERTISNVPFQMGYKTNIKGEYSNMYASTFTVSNEVEDYTTDDEEFVFAKTGYFYYDNNTYSATYDSGKTLIGIVYEVNADGKSGKMVGLEIPESVSGYGLGQRPWSNENIAINTDSDNGRKNMAAIAAITNWKSKYPAFAWAHDHNTDDATIYTDDAIGVWYIPAINELLTLCKAKAAVNTSLKAANKNLLKDDDYFSSTESDSDNASVVYFSYGSSITVSKKDQKYVRVVRAF